MEPTIGRIVTYKLSEEDAKQINRRRTHGGSIAERIQEDKWPIGAQAHIGNTVSEGDKVPMIITAVHGDDLVNGQAILDGTDNFWVLSATKGDENREWNWPKMIK